MSSLAAFLAPLVEWRRGAHDCARGRGGTGLAISPVWSGGGLGTSLLFVLVFSPVLRQTHLPVAWLQVTFGGLLLLFGMSWLRKAVLRVVILQMKLSSRNRIKSELACLFREPCQLVHTRVVRQIICKVTKRTICVKLSTSVTHHHPTSCNGLHSYRSVAYDQ